MIDDDPIGAKWMRQKQTEALAELEATTDPDTQQYWTAVAFQAGNEAKAREDWLQRHPRRTWKPPAKSSGASLPLVEPWYP
jgi:hypothetical protein